MEGVIRNRRPACYECAIENSHSIGLKYSKALRLKESRTMDAVKRVKSSFVQWDEEC